MLVTVKREHRAVQSTLCACARVTVLQCQECHTPSLKSAVLSWKAFPNLQSKSLCHFSPSCVSSSKATATYMSNVPLKDNSSGTQWQLCISLHFSSVTAPPPPTPVLLALLHGRGIVSGVASSWPPPRKSSDLLVTQHVVPRALDFQNGPSWGGEGGVCPPSSWTLCFLMQLKSALAFWLLCTLLNHL